MRAAPGDRLRFAIASIISFCAYGPTTLRSPVAVAVCPSFAQKISICGGRSRLGVATSLHARERAATAVRLRRGRLRRDSHAVRVRTGRGRVSQNASRLGHQQTK